MAKTNYSFEKRQKEIAKKKKQDEKRQKKIASKEDASQEGGIREQQPPVDGTTGE